MLTVNLTSYFRFSRGASPGRSSRTAWGTFSGRCRGERNCCRRSRSDSGETSGDPRPRGPGPPGGPEPPSLTATISVSHVAEHDFLAANFSPCRRAGLPHTVTRRPAGARPQPGSPGRGSRRAVPAIEDRAVKGLVDLHGRRRVRDPAAASPKTRPAEPIAAVSRNRRRLICPWCMISISALEDVADSNWGLYQPAGGKSNSDRPKNNFRVQGWGLGIGD